ncbi:MAG: hypothetical protein ACRD5G_01560 [Candidatus Acidiferrales bacterium]
MDDHSWAQVKIGGRITQDQITELERIADANRYDQDEEANDGGFLTYSDSQAKGALMGPLTEFCEKNELPYDHEWDPCVGYYNAGAVYYRPRTGSEKRTLDTTIEGEPVVPQREVARLLRSGKRIATPRKLGLLRDRLRHSAGLDVSKLQPIKIAG